MSTPENATTWRELAEQLSPAQVEQLTTLEQGGFAPDELIGLARMTMFGAAVDVGLADVEPLAGATVGDWQQGTDCRWGRRCSGLSTPLTMGSPSRSTGASSPTKRRATPRRAIAGFPVVAPFCLLPVRR